jgi:hypothetical protein
MPRNGLPSRRFVVAEVAVAGVYAGHEAVSGGQLGQELAQLGAFGPGERRADGLLVVGGDPASTLSYAQAHTGQLHAAAVLVFGAAVPLAIWVATIYRRLRTLGVTAPGAVIGLAGGILAAASLALSGLVTWVVADTAHIAGPALAKALFDLSFAAGAAGFVVPFALLIAGVAVPSLVLRLTPRPLAWGGLVVAAIGMLSTLTLLTSALDFTLPIGRFGGLIFIVAASAVLPATRHRLTAAVPVAA